MFITKKKLSLLFRNNNNNLYSFHFSYFLSFHNFIITLYKITQRKFGYFSIYMSIVSLS